MRGRTRGSCRRRGPRRRAGLVRRPSGAAPVELHAVSCRRGCLLPPAGQHRIAPWAAAPQVVLAHGLTPWPCAPNAADKFKGAAAAQQAAEGRVSAEQARAAALQREVDGREHTISWLEGQVRPSWAAAGQAGHATPSMRRCKGRMWLRRVPCRPHRCWCCRGVQVADAREQLRRREEELRAAAACQASALQQQLLEAHQEAAGLRRQLAAQQQEAEAARGRQAAEMARVEDRVGGVPRACRAQCCSLAQARCLALQPAGAAGRDAVAPHAAGGRRCGPPSRARTRPSPRCGSSWRRSRGSSRRWRPCCEGPEVGCAGGGAGAPCRNRGGWGSPTRRGEQCKASVKRR
jgi:hypothetical protein